MTAETLEKLRGLVGATLQEIVAAEHWARDAPTRPVALGVRFDRGPRLRLRCDSRGMNIAIDSAGLNEMELNEFGSVRLAPSFSDLVGRTLSQVDRFDSPGDGAGYVFWFEGAAPLAVVNAFDELEFRRGQPAGGKSI